MADPGIMPSATSTLRARAVGKGVMQMTLLRPAFAILIALFGSTADAGPQAVPRKSQAGFYLEGCKDFLLGDPISSVGAVWEPLRSLMI